MKLSQFNFNLPEALIASTPAKQRDESRLMVLDRKTGTIEHKLFKDIIKVDITNNKNEYIQIIDNQNYCTSFFDIYNEKLKYIQSNNSSIFLEPT